MCVFMKNIYRCHNFREYWSGKFIFNIKCKLAGYAICYLFISMSGQKGISLCKIHTYSSRRLTSRERYTSKEVFILGTVLEC